MSKGEVVQTSSTGGQKAGNNVRAGLLPWAELMEVAELYGKGAAKYEANNWMKGYEWSKSFDAMTRHLSEWWLGNEFDDGEGGTGQEHLDCVIFHALALKYFRKHFPQFDDRPVTWAKQQAEALAEPKPWVVLTEDGEYYTWQPDTAVSVIVGGDNSVIDGLISSKTPRVLDKLTLEHKDAKWWWQGASGGPRWLTFYDEAIGGWTDEKAATMGMGVGDTLYAFGGTFTEIL